MSPLSLPDPDSTDPAVHGGDRAARRRRGARFWVVTVAAATAVLLTASLGQWQLGRADQKNQLAAQRDAREAMPVLGHRDFLAALNADTPDALHDRRVELRGQWLDEHTVFLENRTMAGRVGFLVVTPLQLEGTSEVLLVQRGWVPRSFEDRTALPPVATPPEPVLLAGRLAPPPSKLYEFDGGARGQIRQNIDLAALREEWSLPLIPLTLQQVSPADRAESVPDALLRDWPRVGHDVHKHYGYALQWFGLCALLIILYVWFQFIAPRRRRH